jgi:hypothetical protein
LGSAVAYGSFPLFSLASLNFCVFGQVFPRKDVHFVLATNSVQSFEEE